jgi:hypothetical protein
MESHVSARSAQTLQVRVCSNHGTAEDEDSNIGCAGFEVSLQRASDAGYWPEDGIEDSPQIDVTIQRVSSRRKESKEPPGPWLRYETFPVGPALRMTVDEGFDLLRALTRGLKLAIEQGLCSKPERERSRAHEFHEDMKLLRQMGPSNPYDFYVGEEEKDFDRLVQQNRLAQRSRSSATKASARGRTTRARRSRPPARATKKQGRSARRHREAE